MRKVNSFIPIMQIIKLRVSNVKGSIQGRGAEKCERRDLSLNLSNS